MRAFRRAVPTEIEFGAGQLRSLHHTAGALGNRPFVIAGKSSARRSGALDTIVDQFSDAVVFTGVEENPGTLTCENAARMCKEHGCDFVIGVGGGSAIDVAKAVAVLANNPGPCADYFGTNLYTNEPLDIVAIPTTSGAGSETTPYAVLVDDEKCTKRTISGNALYPAYAILDPDLTVSLPKSVTINSGLDALSQALEGAVSLRSTPVGDETAEHVCRVVRRWLPVAARDGGDLKARSEMLYASALSGSIIAHSGTTLVHGMGYYLTLEFGVAHGLANALLLSPMFVHNAQYMPGKVAALATALGHPAEATPTDAAEKIVRALHEFLGKLGVSPAAADAGVEQRRLRYCAERVCSEPSRFRNQAGAFTVDEIEGIYNRAYEGAAF